MSKTLRHPSIGIVSLLALLMASQSLADDSYSVATRLYQAGKWEEAVAAFDRVILDSQHDGSTRLAARLYAGESLVQLGRRAEAGKHYRLLLEHDAQNHDAQNPNGQHPNTPARLAAQAQFRLGETAWLSGDTAQAARQLQTYVERYPLDASVAHAEAYLARLRDRTSMQQQFADLDEAVGCQRDGRHDAALAAYRALLEQESPSPVRAEALRRIAKLHDSLAQTREALNYYGEYLAEYPDSPRTAQVLFAVAWIYHRLDQPAQASEHFRKVHANFPQSAQAADAAYWLALANADNRTRVGQANRDGDSSDEQGTGVAEEYVDWLLAQKRLPLDRPPLWARTLCLKCQLFAQQGQWQAVAQLVDTARERLRSGPSKTKLEFWEAEAAFRLRRYQTARTRFTALHPKTIGIEEAWTAMVPLRRAQLAARRQQWSEVLKLVEQLEHGFPGFELDYEVDYLRGRALAGRGEMTAARKYYSRVLKNEAANNSETATMAGWMIGETFFHQRDYARARDAYRKVIEQTALPQWQSRAALQAGKCWELQQRWDEAAKVYTTALAKWPETDSDHELESRLRWAQSQLTRKR